jgi:hypothetical protein
MAWLPCSLSGPAPGWFVENRLDTDRTDIAYGGYSISSKVEKKRFPIHQRKTSLYRQRTELIQEFIALTLPPIKLR